MKWINRMWKETNETNRNQWIETQLKLLPKGTKLLDAGAGQCKWKRYCDHLDYVSQDFCQYEGTGNKKGLQTEQWDTHEIDIVSDIMNIPVEDGAFDAVLCSEVLEHLPYPELAIKELSRITREGGVLLLTAPFNSLTHFAPYHFSTGFNLYWYERHLKENGYEIIEAKNNGDYFTYFDQELGRLPSVMDTYLHRSSFLVKLCSVLLRVRLKQLTKAENSSYELQCMGYLVKAKKEKGEKA